MYKKIAISIFVLMMLSSCTKEIVTSISNASRIEIPNADIVFNSIDKKNFSDVIGFYSLQNQGTEIVNFNWNTIIPYYVNSKELMVINKKGYPGDYIDRNGYLMVLEGNEIRRCYSPQTFGQYAKPHGEKVLFNSSQGILLISPENCSVVKTILSYEDIQISNSDYFDGSFDLSANENLLIFSNRNKLLLFDFSTGETKDLQVNGVYPSISPNQENVAYLGPDGIYLMDINGNSTRLVVSYDATKDGFYSARGNPSKPNWSPDSTKLVYHKCNQPININCTEIEDYDIFIYDLATQKENLIIHGGLNPSWNYFKN